jgi:hypothetical protein
MPKRKKTKFVAKGIDDDVLDDVLDEIETDEDPTVMRDELREFYRLAIRKEQEDY